MGIVLDKVGFDIVHGCQLRCVGCPNSSLEPAIKLISVSDFSQCLKNIDVDHIKLFRLFNFGEPAFHKDLAELAAISRKQAWSVGCLEISTNAQYHPWDRIEELFRTNALDRLAVSCDGDGSPEDYERLRPPSKWVKLIDFLVKAKELRDKHSQRTKLITRTICGDLKSQERWNAVLKPLGWEPEFREWLLLPQSVENPSGRQGKRGNGLCSFMTAPRLYVDYDGTVVPCCMHPKAFELGSLKTEKYSEISSGKRKSEKRQELLTNRERMPVCAGCEL